MEKLDTEFLAQYFESEIARLTKVKDLAEHRLAKHQSILATYKQYGAAQSAERYEVSRINHCHETLDKVVPKIEKLQEQLDIVKDSHA